MSIEDTQPAVPADTGAVELTALEVQRVDWFEELGFDLEQALTLATARDSARQLVPVHDVRKAIDGGCSLDVAFQIFS